MPTDTTRGVVAGIVLLLAALTAPAAHALLHLPHDNAKQVVLSPSYGQDRTVFAVVQLTTHTQILRSVDAGERWDVLGTPFLNEEIGALVLSPEFAADRTLFAVAGPAGLWRSTDAGEHWESWGSGLPASSTKSVALSPDFGQDGCMLVGTLDGLYRSTDAGATWAPVTAGYTDSSAAQLQFAPDDASLVFAGTITLHRSDDGGVTWVPLQTFGLPLEALGLSPQVSVDGLLAVGFGRFGGGVQVSGDGGVAWASADAGLLEATVNELAVAEDGTAFAVTTLSACYRAPALGAAWTLHDDGYEENTDQTSNHHQGIAPSPTFGNDGEVFVASFEGLHRSTDGGLSWSQLDTHNQRLNLNVALTPGGEALYAANYGGGVLRLSLDQLDDDGAPVVAGPVLSAPSTAWLDTAAEAPHPRTPPGPPVGVLAEGWSSRAHGHGDLYAGELAVSPDFTHDRTLYYGLLGLARSTDGGRNWTSLPVPAPFPRALALVDDFATDPTLMFGTYTGGTFISHDGGDTWADAAGGLPTEIKVSGLALSPDFGSDGRAWLASVSHGVWRSLDGTASWHPVGAAIGTDTVRSVAVSPDVAIDGLVLAGTGGHGLWRSTDAGDGWAPVTAGIPSGGQAIIEAIAFSPDFAVDGVVFIAVNGDGVLRSDDGGLSFGLTSNGLSPSAPRDLAVSRQFGSDATLFVSTYDWVWRSTDGGGSWARLPGFLHVDETHPTVTAGGPWLEQGDGAAHGGAWLRSNQPGASMQWSFHGGSVACHLGRGPDAGVVDIELDGRLVERIDLHATAPLGSTAVWSRSFPVAGPHSLRVVVTGLSSAASTGASVSFDGFRYTF